MLSNLRILPIYQTIRNNTMSGLNIHIIPTALTGISAKIEGLTAAKASNPSEMCERERECVCVVNACASQKYTDP